MKTYVWLTIGLLVVAPLSAAAAQHPSASVPSGDIAAPLARHWQGLAQETPGIYLGPVKANVEPMPTGRDTTTVIALHPVTR